MYVAVHITQCCSTGAVYAHVRTCYRTRPDVLKTSTQPGVSAVIRKSNHAYPQPRVSAATHVRSHVCHTDVPAMLYASSLSSILWKPISNGLKLAPLARCCSASSSLKARTARLNSLVVVLRVSMSTTSGGLNGPSSGTRETSWSD